MVAVTSADDGRRFVGHAYLIERAGVSVISDIDDTIKISEVRTKKALLRNTFLEPFRAVDGMADVYRRWIDSHGTAFHYVTASPWQLYEPLRGFLEDAGFPSGTLHMKPFRWKDEAFLSLFESPEKYKPDVIDSLVARFPRRRFVLVGDSGEKDPEIYGAAARKHEKQIVAILIRDVTQESADGPRYKECFAGLSRELWRIFRDPVEIRAALDGIAVSPSDNPRGDRR
jgi:phosphatidate phosphatase APP1